MEAWMVKNEYGEFIGEPLSSKENVYRFYFAKMGGEVKDEVKTVKEFETYMTKQKFSVVRVKIEEVKE